MRNTASVNYFLINDFAVSEEFTTLPALSVVMIGFALFAVLFSQTYLSYETRMEQLQEYQTADTLACTLTNPDCYFIKESRLVNLPLLLNDTSSLQRLCDQWRQSGICFLLRLHWANITMDFPANNNTSSIHRVAVSRHVGIFLSDTQTVPGVLTILLWRNP
jgi:hypothetical protein